MVSKELKRGHKRQLIEAVVSNDGDYCLRCGEKKTHFIQECPAASEDCWREGPFAQNLEDDEERKAAETVYEAQMDKIKKKQAAAEAAKKAADAEKEKGNKKDQKPGGAPTKKETERVPDPDCHDVGRVELVNYSYPQKQTPSIDVNQVWPNEYDEMDEKQADTGFSTAKGKGRSKDQDTIKVISNYVRVTEIPDCLYVHSLTFWRHKKKGKVRQTYDKRRDIKSAFEAAFSPQAPQNDTAGIIMNKSEGGATVKPDGVVTAAVEGSESNQAEHDVTKIAESSKNSSSMKRLDLSDKVWATDYKSLWTTTPLIGTTPDISKEISEDYGDFIWAPPGQPTVPNLRFTLTFKKVLDNIRERFSTMAAHELSEETRALNAVIARSTRDIQGKNKIITQVGPNKFYLNGAYESIPNLGPEQYRVQRGYFTSIRPSKSGPLLNVNIANTAFLPPILVSDLLGRFSANETDYVEKLLKGCMVRIVYRRQKYVNGADLNIEQNRVKEFQQFGLTAEKQKWYKTESRKEGTKTVKVGSDDAGTTVFDYYNKSLKLPVTTDKEMLCVNVGRAARKISKEEAQEPLVMEELMREQSEGGAVWVPADLLEICPNQPTRAVLNANHAKAMIDNACRQPTENAALIDEEGLQELRIKGDQQQLRAMGLRTGTNLIAFSAGHLATPTIMVRDGKVEVKEASWDLRNQVFPSSAPIRKLQILCSNRSRDNLSRDIASALRSHLGLNVLPHGVTDGGWRQLAALLKNTAKDVCTVVVLHSNNENDYARLKQVADLGYGRSVVCMLLNKVVHRMTSDLPKDKSAYQQYLTNLCMKINMKGGGINHQVAFTAGKLNLNKTIVFGADVTHPGASQCIGYPSIACVVASVDRYFMNYPGSMRLQAGRQEEIAELQAMVKERLEAWSKKNRGDFPENIVFYRDGISESQFSASKKKEIEAIRDAYNELCPGTQLKLTFVVVGKRHNTRFYPSNLKEDAVNVDHKDTRRTNTNLKPGLYVEGVITDPRTEEGSQFDFYLQAHNAIKGTARSAHYHVLTDEIGFKGQELPDLTHQLSYAFAQATKGVSYVAPAYTADRLCERGRVYLRNWVPDWEYQKPTHASGHPIQNPNADDLKEYRERMALKLSRDNVWRHFKDSNAKEPGRGNPWHPDLDDSMFWM